MDVNDDRPRVFISYSRIDSETAEALRDQLISAGFHAYLDLHDIKAGEPWRERLGTLIGGAEKVVFLISPHSVQSEICGWEVDHAERLGKSIVPIVIQATPLESVPGRLSRLNLVFMRTRAEREDAFDALVEALSIDLAWDREKTRLNDLAMAWEVAGRPNRLLMFADEAIAAAERWRDSHPSTSPAPTEIQLAFVAESRARRVRRQRLFTATTLVVAGAMGVLAFVAYLQREAAIVSEQQAQEQRVIAEQQRTVAEAQRDEALRAQSRFLAHASSEALRRADVGNALALARAALPGDFDRPDRPVIDEAVDALMSAVAAERRELRTLRGVRYMYDGYAVSSDQTRFLALATDGEPPSLIDTRTLDIVAALDAAGGPGVAGRFSPDDRWALVWGVDDTVRLFDAGNGMPGPTLTGHVRPVVDVAFTPDGATLATVSDDGAARLWDTATGDAGLVLTGHTGGVRGAVFGPDGRTLASWGDDRTVRVWDVTSGKAIAVLQSDLPVQRVTFDADGTRLLTESGEENAGGTAIVRRLWNPSDGSGGQVLKTAEGRTVDAAEFTPGGARILVIDGDSAAVVDAVDGTVLHRLTGHTSPIRGYRFDSAGQRVLTWAADRTVRVWSLADGLQQVSFGDHTDIILGAQFSDDGAQVLSWGFDRTARLWDASTGATRSIFRGHDGTVSHAAFLDGGETIFTASGNSVADMMLDFNQGDVRKRELDGTFRLWDAESGAQIGLMAGYEAPALAVVLLPKVDRLIGASMDLSTRLWDISRDAAGPGKEIRIAGGQVATAAFSPDGKRLMIGAGELLLSDFGYTPGRLRALSVWEVGDGRPVGSFDATSDAIAGAALDGDGSRIALWTEEARQARLGAIGGGAETVPLAAEGDKVQGMRRSHDGSRLVTWDDDGGGRVWDLGSGGAIAAFKSEDPITGATFSPDAGQIVTWGGDSFTNLMFSMGGDRGSARLWNARTGEAGPILSGHEEQVTGAAFSADGTRVATWSGGIVGGENSVRIFDAATGEPSRVFNYGGSGLLAARFDPSGSRLLAWGLDGVVLWDVSGSIVDDELYHSTEAITPPAFSPDGRQLMLIDIDGNLSVLEAATLAAERWIEAPGGQAFVGAVFAPDGQWIAAWAHDDAVRLWPANVAVAAQEADGLIAKLQPLSEGERCIYLPEAATDCNR